MIFSTFRSGRRTRGWFGSQRCQRGRSRSGGTRAWLARLAVVLATAGVLASVGAPAQAVAAVAAPTGRSAVLAPSGSTAGDESISAEDAEFYRQLVQDIVDYSSDPEERQAAQEALDSGDPVVLKAFLDGGIQAAKQAAADRKAAQATANRAVLQQWVATGTPTVQSRAAALLATGTDAQIADFVAFGHLVAEAQDAQAVTDAAADQARILSRVQQAVATGGPQVRALGQAALDTGDPAVIAEFFQHGFSEAMQRDSEMKQAIDAALAARDKAIQDLIVMAEQETRAATARTQILQASADAVRWLSSTATNMTFANEAARKAEEIYQADLRMRQGGAKGRARELAGRTREAKQEAELTANYAQQVAGAAAAASSAAKTLVETGLTKGIDWAQVVQALGNAAQAATKAAESAWHAAEGIEAASAALDADANAQTHADQAIRLRQDAEAQAKQAHDLEQAAAAQAAAAQAAAARAHDQRQRAEQAAASANTHAANAATAMNRARTQRAKASQASTKAVSLEVAAKAAGKRAIEQQDAAIEATKAAIDAHTDEGIAVYKFTRLADSSNGLAVTAEIDARQGRVWEIKQDEQIAKRNADAAAGLSVTISAEAAEVEKQYNNAQAAATQSRAEASAAAADATAAAAEADRASAAARAAADAARTAQAEADKAKQDAATARDAADQANAEAAEAHADAQAATGLANAAVACATQASVDADLVAEHAQGAVDDAADASFQARLAARAAVTTRAAAAAITAPATAALEQAATFGDTDSDAAFAGEVAARAVTIGQAMADAATKHAAEAQTAADHAAQAAQTAGAQIAPAYQAAAAAAASAAAATRSAEVAIQAANTASDEAQGAYDAADAASDAESRAYRDAQTAAAQATAASNDAAVARQAKASASNAAGVADTAATNAQNAANKAAEVKVNAQAVNNLTKTALGAMQKFVKDVAALVEPAEYKRAQLDAQAKLFDWVESANKFLEDKYGKDHVMTGVSKSVLEMAESVWLAGNCASFSSASDLACQSIVDGFKEFWEHPEEIFRWSEFKEHPWTAAGMVFADVTMLGWSGGASLGPKIVALSVKFDVGAAKAAAGAIATGIGEIGIKAVAESALKLGIRNTAKMLEGLGSAAFRDLFEQVGADAIAKSLTRISADKLIDLVNTTAKNDLKTTVDDLAKNSRRTPGDLPDTEPIEPKSGPGCVNSFTPDTPVLLADGTTRPIADIHTGDQVRSTDPVSGTTSAQTVSQTHRNQDRDLVDLTIQTADGTTSILHTTAEHPFYTTTNTWTNAADLTPGTGLYTGTNTAEAHVQAIKTWTGLQWMHNLTVDTTHTYYVLAGRTPVLVHNSDVCLTAGKNFKPHFLKRKTLLQSVTGHRYSTLAEGGPQFLSDLSDMVNNGTLRYEGQGTLKVGQPAGNIYRGNGLTLVTTQDGEFWTLLKSGEGLDKAIVMVPDSTG